jgi:hypothetical protein
VTVTPLDLEGVLYVLDTNVVSEWMRPEVDRDVTLWLDRVGAGRLAIAAPTVSELRYGVERLPDGSKREALKTRIEELLALFFDRRVIPFGRDEADACGRLMAKKRALGDGLEDHIADAMIAACALVAGLAVATRNEAQFRNTGVKFVNPWKKRTSGRRRR